MCQDEQQESSSSSTRQVRFRECCYIPRCIMPRSSGSMTTPRVYGRATFTLTALPQDVLEMIVCHLKGNNKVGPLPVPAQLRKLRLWV